jgi:hypothetical protein
MGFPQPEHCRKLSCYSGLAWMCGVKSYWLQVRQQLIWWFCFEICKQRGGLTPSFVAAGVCVISADTSSIITAATQSLHTREDPCVWVQTQPACRQPRKKGGLEDDGPWRQRGEEFCNAGLQQSGTGTVGPNLAVIETCPVPRTRRLSRISGTRSGPPQELSLCTGTAHLVALWLDSAFAGSLASTKFCYRPNWTGTFTVLSHSRLGVLSQCGFFPFSFQLISY